MICATFQAKGNSAQQRTDMSAVHRSTPTTTSTVDDKDQATWSRVAREWWDLNGPMRPLHHMNPARVKYITQQTLHHFARQDTLSPSRLEDLCASYSSHLQQVQDAGIDYCAKLSQVAAGTLSPPSDAPLRGLTMLDVGCGAGIVAEHLAYLGADVVGVDSTPETPPVGRVHAKAMGLDLEYIHGTTDDLVAQHRQFDVVCCLEVVEHVTDVDHFVAGLAK
ncbi:3-demethylubiquinone-9 3-methyltransferase [Salpingoeca rosetta]|uniref:3-demethylubiquinone-9 3-methyltransferase n=1 Tax=Salpingoeca rosetta (strain ATCC 50818 / BSB-021) TaxID=946362 RepID=F2U3E8_SALR5|nr:3-demethylubiquinone-9 3-methyltransferase [Salpingoeca rosetta]EGD82142.1 3-demethylubiquinone-9 3-methyltransferase [Salpingoeca rosetta]|eukprot:XP_004996325.1 3-demethylubiquinone-9 3-methyltransferase [Salpingoeca rosetta]